MMSLSNIFDGVTSRTLYSISKTSFEELQALCATDEGVLSFLNTANKSNIMDTLIALAQNAEPSHKALATQILCTPKVFSELHHYEAPRLKRLVFDSYAFTREQKLKILCTDGVVWDLALYGGQADMLMNLLKGNSILDGMTLTPEERRDLLCTPNAVAGLAHRGQYERLIRFVVDGDTFTRAQKLKILCTPNAINGLLMTSLSFPHQLMRLLEGTTSLDDEPLTPQEKSQILNVPNVVETLSAFKSKNRVAILLAASAAPNSPASNLG
ncbi:MAG: hypothetical protein AAB276_02365 [Pseudomonadota bacterium]